jgi:hypothetical protein
VAAARRGRSAPRAARAAVACAGRPGRARARAEKRRGLRGPAPERVAARAGPLTSSGRVHGRTLGSSGSTVSELGLRDALRGRDREQVVASVTFGLARAEPRDPRPRRSAGRGRERAPLPPHRLGSDDVDVDRLGRLDPAVPIEETVGASSSSCVPSRTSVHDRRAARDRLGALAPRRHRAARRRSDHWRRHSAHSRSSSRSTVSRWSSAPGRPRSWQAIATTRGMAILDGERREGSELRRTALGCAAHRRMLVDG